MTNQNTRKSTGCRSRIPTGALGAQGHLGSVPSVRCRNHEPMFAVPVDAQQQGPSAGLMHRLARLARVSNLFMIDFLNHITAL